MHDIGTDLAWAANSVDSTSKCNSSAYLVGVALARDPKKEAHEFPVYLAHGHRNISQLMLRITASCASTSIRKLQLYSYGMHWQ